MKIKNRLSLYFTLISGVMLLVVMTAIYLAFSHSLRSDFYLRLKERTLMTAGLYLEADEVSEKVLANIREKVLQKIPGEVTRIYNARNEGVFIPDSQQYWSSRVIDEVRERKYIQYREGDRQVVGLFYHDNQGDFVIMASAKDDGSFRRLKLLEQIMILVFCAVMFLSFLSGRFLAEKLLSPIDTLIRRMRTIGASNLHMRVETGDRNDEISMLAQNFNHLLERLESSFEQQAAFVANASHELRTPVTSIIGEAEVGLKQARSPEEYRRILQSVRADSVRLKEIIAALLELAQVDSKFTGVNLQPVRMDELLWELYDHWSNILSPESLKIVLDDMPSDESGLTVRAGRSLLYIALNNIIANAFKFSDGGEVACTLASKDGFVTVRISDRGIGISEEEIPRIFAAFYRSPSAGHFQGSGVGLYLTNRIITVFGGTLTVQKGADTGTTVLVTLPVAAVAADGQTEVLKF